MNTNPAETDLALWLEDELQGESLAAFEAGEGRQEHHLAARAEVRRLKALLAANLPAREEPPYPDFFNSRVMRAIRQAQQPPAAVVKRRFWRHPALMPLTACAGMALTFWLGARTHPGALRDGQAAVAATPVTLIAEPFVYAPESGVRVERFASSDAMATVIVLDGVAAIPDAMDFSKYVSPQAAKQSGSTAETAAPDPEASSL